MNNIIKNKIRILSLVILSLFIWGCSDTDYLTDGLFPNTGHLVARLNVGEMTEITTRADEPSYESDVNNLTLLIFSGETNALIQKETLYDGDSRMTSDEWYITLDIPLSLDVTGNCKTYLIANAAGLLENFSGDLSSFLGITDNSVFNSTPNIVMWAYYEGELGKSMLYLDLKRVCAKFTIMKGASLPSSGGPTDAEPNSEYHFGASNYSQILGLCAHGAKEGYLYPVEDGSDTYNESFRYVEGSYYPENWSSAQFATDVAYIYPTQKGSAPQSSEGYIIVKVGYKERESDTPTECYYRIDLYGSDSYAGEYDELLSINPNRHYWILISGITAPGYSTAEEASQHPGDGLSYVVSEENPPMITSIVTDGINELGVSHNITIEDYQDNWVYISCYSPYDSMYETVNRQERPAGLTLTVTEGGSWLNVDMDTLTECDESEYGPTYNDLRFDFGYSNRRVWKAKVYANGAPAGAIGEISVKWGNLSRTVAVNVDGIATEQDIDSWDMVQMCEITMHDMSQPSGSNQKILKITTISQDSQGGYVGMLNGESQVTHYYSYVGGPGTGNSQAYPLYGVSAEAMGEENRRDRGFHFPVMYGENPGWYEYDVSFIDEALRGVESYSFSLENADESVWKYLSLSINQTDVKESDRDITNLFESKPVFTHNPSDNFIRIILRRCDLTKTDLDHGYQGVADDYKYDIAKLVLTVNPGTDSEKKYKFTLYHTGFFHPVLNYEYQRRYIGQENDNNVLGYYYYEVREMGDNYWLDRNVGAKSNGYYAQDGSGNSALSAASWPYNDDARGGYFKAAQYTTTKGIELLDDVYKSGYPYQRVSIPGYKVPSQSDWDALTSSPYFGSYNENAGSSIVTVYKYDSPDGIPVYFPASRYLNGSNLNGNSCEGYYWTSNQGSPASTLQVLHLGSSIMTYDNLSVDYYIPLRCVSSK